MRNGAHHEDERLSAFLDDELPEDDALLVTRHLAGCATCLEELERIREARSALRGLPSVHTPAVLLPDAATVAAANRRGRAVRTAIAAVTATALVAGAAYAAGAHGGGTVIPPVDDFVADHVVRVGTGPMVSTVNLTTPGS